MPSDARWGPHLGSEQLLISYEKPNQATALQQLKSTLQSHSGWLGGYLPDNAVLGLGSEAAAEACRQLEGVIWVVSDHFYDTCQDTTL